MGYLITSVKVTLEQERRRNKPFHFTVATDGTDEDMLATINKGLEQKVKEGEITQEDIQRTKKIEIASNDKKGYFNTIIGDIGNFFKSL